MIKKTGKGKELLLIILVGLSIVALWCGSGWYINRFIDSNYRGIVGDMFGAVNALFSGLAFAGLIYTITVQSKELKLQRESIDMQTQELSLQRKVIEMQTNELKQQHVETARSANQLQMQQKLMNYQIVLTTVNDLLKLKNEAIHNINTSDGHTQVTNRFHAWNRSNNYNDEQVLGELYKYKEVCFSTLQFVLENELSLKQLSNLKQIVKINFTKVERSTLTTLAKQETDEHRVYRIQLLESFDMVE